jgi:uncharacterized protein
MDSSAYYANAVERDARHDQAVRMFRQLQRNRSAIFTTRYVVAETHALLINRQRNSRLAFAFLTAIASSPGTTIVDPTPEDENAAREILRRYDDKFFSLTHAISFAVMQRLRLPVAFTFDDDFVQAGFGDLRQILRP